MWRIAECLLCLGLAVAAAQEVPAEDSPKQHRIPSWMTWGAEFRVRLESPRDLNFEPDLNDGYAFIRIRIWAGAEVNPWLRFYVQGQDARAPGFSDSMQRDAVVHHVDFRQAYTDLGRLRGAWELRAGRQELAFGDERLVGADGYWDALGQTFDGLRMTYRRTGLRLDAFGAFVVLPNCLHLASPSTGNRLSGVYAAFDKGPGGSVMEPYLFWKSDRVRPGGLESEERNDILTYGVRTAGNLPARADYNVEMALQGGRRTNQSVRAWAGHWELGVRPFRTDFGPRWAAEYNFASGDRNPNDRQHSTFDDLYPAGFNRFGVADPFAWRNLRSLSGGVDWSLTKRWRVSFGYRAFWLACVQDGLYTKGDSFLVRNADASSDFVGRQASAMVAWERSSHWQLYAGYARFFPGSYLTGSSYQGRFSTPFLMVNYRFE